MVLVFHSLTWEAQNQSKTHSELPACFNDLAISVQDMNCLNLDLETPRHCSVQRRGDSCTILCLLGGWRRKPSSNILRTWSPSRTIVFRHSHFHEARQQLTEHGFKKKKRTKIEREPHESKQQTAQHVGNLPPMCHTILSPLLQISDEHDDSLSQSFRPV